MVDIEINGRVAKAEISVFDAIHAELLGEKELRAEKFRRTHDLCKKSKDKTPADRKHDKKVRMRKLYGLAAFEDTNHGKTVFYWDVKGGAKKFPEYEAEILRNMKDAELERYAFADMLGDPEHYVGKTTLTKQMDRAYRRMQKIANDFCEKNGYQWGERYAYDPKNHYYHVDYPNEFYDARCEYLLLESKCNEKFAEKMQKGEC